MVDLVGKKVPAGKCLLRDLFIKECERSGLQVYSSDTLIEGEWDYLVVSVDGMRYCGSDGLGYELLTLEHFGVNTWDGLCPSDMSLDQAKAFLEARFSGIPMQMYIDPEWGTTMTNYQAMSFCSGVIYRVDNSREDEVRGLLDLIEKSKQELGRLGHKL